MQFQHEICNMQGSPRIANGCYELVDTNWDDKGGQEQARGGQNWHGKARVDKSLQGLSRFVTGQQWLDKGHQ